MPRNAVATLFLYVFLAQIAGNIQPAFGDSVKIFHSYSPINVFLPSSSQCPKAGLVGLGRFLWKIRLWNGAPD